jgi:hypothetical protein
VSSVANIVAGDTSCYRYAAGSHGASHKHGRDRTQSQDEGIFPPWSRRAGVAARRVRRSAVRPSHGQRRGWSGVLGFTRLGGVIVTKWPLLWTWASLKLGQPTTSQQSSVSRTPTTVAAALIRCASHSCRSITLPPARHPSIPLSVCTPPMKRKWFN